MGLSPEILSFLMTLRLLTLTCIVALAAAHGGSKKSGSSTTTTSSPTSSPSSPSIPSPNNAITNYYTSGNLVAFYVYRIHDGPQTLDNDNAASPGGEIGFIANEYGYSDGTISRDCVVMYNQEFSSYDCCNGGSCSGCGYAGSGSGPSNMPGRSYQLYPPPGAPSTCSQSDTCSGAPTQTCGGQCSGWWYSFQTGGAKCAVAQTPSATGCTWYNSPVMQIVQFAALIASPGFYSCQSAVNNQPPGGCQGYLGWTQFMSSVDALYNLFQTPSAVSTVVFDPTTQGFNNVSVPAYPDPQFLCKAPCPAGSFSGSGYLDIVNQCQLCAPGTYNSNQASTSCSPCPSGASSPAGATSAAQCTGGSSSSPSSDGSSDASSDGSDASDADGSLLADNAAGSSVAPSRAGSLPAYGVALVIVASALLVAAVAIAVVRRRRFQPLDNVEMSVSNI